MSHKSGRYVIQWRDALRVRHTLPIGRMSRKDAERTRGYVEDLIAARLGRHAPPQAVSAWVGELDDALHKRLAHHGLVPSRDAKTATELGAFTEAYIERRKGELKERSRSILGQVRKYLIEHFGAEQAIEHISRGDAKDYRRFIATKAGRKGKGLAGATVSMHVMRARMMFEDALDRRLIAENPFAKLAAGPQTNESRKVYVEKADVAKVIDATPDINWKLLFALARYAGLRTPSESYALRWSDILWDKRRMVVSSPKTERHAGKDKRIVPITPDLLPLLQRAFDAAPEGAVHVIGGNRAGNPNTTARKLVARAGLTPWTKPFHNLRASCQTDWCAEVSVASACAMIGNTALIAAKHYLMPKDDHYDLLSGLVGIGSTSAAQSAAQGREKGRKEMAGNPEILDDSAEKLLAEYPRQGFNPALDSVEKLIEARKALQKALHAATEAQYEFRLRSLAQIEEAISAARKGGAA